MQQLVNTELATGRCIVDVQGIFNIDLQGYSMESKKLFISKRWHLLMEFSYHIVQLRLSKRTGMRREPV